MPLKIVKAITSFVDYFYSITLQKKFYFLLVIMIIGLVSILLYYEKRVTNINNFHNNRYNDIVVFYQDKLEDCHSENKKQYNQILSTLQNALEESQENAIKAEQNRIELEKLKK